MGSGGGGGTQIIPFNMSELAPLMPSVFNGPYNAEGAYQNAQTLQQQYPWITPPAGEFAGAQPGQFAGATSGNNSNPLLSMLGLGGLTGGGGSFGFPGSGVPAAPNPNPPIPPTLPPTAGQTNPMALAGNQVNAMQPSSLQQILAVLGAQAPAGGTNSGGNG